MKSKSAIAIAVAAGGLSLPMVVMAGHGVQLLAPVGTPLSSNETSSFYTGSERDQDWFSERAALSSHETPRDAVAQREAYSGFYLIGVPASSDTEYYVTQLQPVSSMERQDITGLSSQSLSEALAQTDRYSDFYLVGVPASDYAGYYVVELQPAPNAEGHDVAVLMKPGASTERQNIAVLVPHR